MTDSTESKSQQPTSAPPWYKAFPDARAKCPDISSDEVMQLFDDMDIKNEPRGFLLVDVRRDDWVGGTIKTSLNLPAQSFYQTRKTLFELCDRAGITKIIFYCGSSTGRGPRCAGWMQDYIDDVAKFGKKSSMEVLVLTGGIKGWVGEFEGMLMDGFEEEKWEEVK